MQIYGIFTEYPWKIMENMRKIIPFLSISFHNLFRMTRFSRSISFHFITISFLFIPQPLDFIPQMLKFS